MTHNCRRKKMSRLENLQEPAMMTSAHTEFLNELKTSGQTNMFGAKDFLMDEFIDLKEKEAKDILLYWMAVSSKQVNAPNNLAKPKM